MVDFKLIAIALSIALQLFGAIVAITLIRQTKYNSSWILISIALMFMAFRRIIELISHLEGAMPDELEHLYNWLGFLTSLLIAFGVFFITKIFKLLKLLDLSRSRAEQRILNAIIRTEEAERQRFAKDLHDGLGPLLSSIKMLLSALKIKSLSDPDKEVVENAHLLINEAIGSIKDVSNNLSPHVLNNFGIDQAIRSFAEKISLGKEIAFDIRSEIVETRFGFNTETVVYRVLCELIHNTIKHTKATKITISMTHPEHKLKVTYTDNGPGFVLEEALHNDHGGMGLSNIISRLKSVDGNIEFIQAGNGLLISIVVND